MRHLFSIRRFCLVLVTLATACCVGVAQEKWSAPAGESLELRELRAALELSQAEVRKEAQRADDAEARRRALAESLAEAVRVSEEQLASAHEAELKLQALGMAGISGDPNSLDQRLLKAVRDLDISEQDLESHREALRHLSETFLKVLQEQKELPKGLRSEADRALAKAGEVMAKRSTAAQPAAADLAAARVVSIDGGIGLVVFDAGRQTGLRVGTPVAILRGDEPLFSALVVDVRDSIAGAVLQDRMAASGEVEVGDRVRLLPEQNTF